MYSLKFIRRNSASEYDTLLIDRAVFKIIGLNVDKTTNAFIISPVKVISSRFCYRLSICMTAISICQNFLLLVTQKEID